MHSTTEHDLYLIVAMALITLLTGVSVGQVATGTPKFGSFDGSFDTVNLGNLNVHLSVPVLHKAGRGMPFAYDLSYDSSVWYPVTSGSTTSWQPVFNWGWQSSYAANTGEITFAIRMFHCPEGGDSYTVTGPYTYYDPWGIKHPFPGAWITASSCSTAADPFPATASDGSGLVLTSTNAISPKVVTPGGAVLAPPHNLSGGSLPTSVNITDANGNEITANSSGVFTDTLGQTTLTIAGAPPSNTTFTYTPPSGTNVAASMSYVSYNIKTNFQCSGISEYTATGVYLVDKITLPDNSEYSFTYEATPSHSGYVTGRLASVTLPTGGKITYTYNGIVCADGSATGFTRALTPGGSWSYSRSGGGSAWTTTVTDPASNATVVSFEKDTATTVPTNNFYETKRVVNQGSSTALQTVYTCYNGNGVSSPSSCATTAVASPISQITSFTQLPDSSGVVSETDSTYTLGLIDEVDEYGYGIVGSGSPGSVIRKTITSYASLGNGIVDRPSSVKITDSGGTRAYTTYAYDETAVSTTSGTPQHVSITGSRGNLTSVVAEASASMHLYRKYTYYDTGILNTSTDVSTSSTTNGATTTYNYANSTDTCGNAFATSISEPLSLSRSMQWDCVGGVLKKLTDENGNYSTTSYTDAYFWRPHTTADFGGNTTTFAYANPNQTESTMLFNGGSSVTDVLTTTDGFGQVTFTQIKQGPSASNYDTVATCYDSVGRQNLVTLPYSTTAVTTMATCPSSNPGTSYAYDGMNRISTRSDSGGGSTSYTYTSNDVYQSLTPAPSGENAKRKQLEYDALGRLASVCEVTSASGSGTCTQNGGSPTGYWTEYTYDALGDLTGVTQNAQTTPTQSRSYAYDMLGRLTSETNPENNNTSTTYAYDSLSGDAYCGTVNSAGNLVKRLDPAGNAACYGYDTIHRPTSIIYPSTSTPAKYFVYDAAVINGTTMSNVKTRMAEAYTCTGTCSSKITDLGFSYSANGQGSDAWESTPHSSGWYHVSSLYWANGSVETLSGVPSVPTITYNPDGEGRVSTVSASTGQNPVTSTFYNPAGSVTALTFGSSDNDSFTFDSSTYRMTNYSYKVGTSPQTVSGTLTWNPNGTLKQLVITDPLNSANAQTCTYTHDDLGRVGSGHCGSSIFAQDFSYDPFGNITKTVPVGSTGTSFQPTYDTTNLTNRITSTPFSYGTSPTSNYGNLTADGAHTYGWDTAGKLTTVDSGASNGVCLTYDALGRMVEQGKGSACATSPTSSTEIIYSPSGGKLALMNGQTLTKAFVSLPSGAQAVYISSGLSYYRHADWLGSSRLATSTTRMKYYDVAYAPFGENYSGSGTQDLSFTGQNQDTESSSSGGSGGLYDFLYREHSPVQGRWLSPDPAGLAAAKPADPQTWNRYAYVGNRPLGTTDPLGLYQGPPIGQPPCSPFDPDCWGPAPCDPSDPSCEPCDPSDPDCVWPPQPNPPPPQPIGGGGSPSSPARQGGVWPDNETLGLPGGLNIHPLSLADLFGLSPGTECGDFIECGLIGPGPMSFNSTTAPYPVPWEWEIPEWISGVGAILSLTLGMTGDAPARPRQPCNLIGEALIGGGKKRCIYKCLDWRGGVNQAVCSEHQGCRAVIPEGWVTPETACQ